MVEACAQLAEALLRTCPHLRVLATSRELLGIAGEQPYQVPSLSLPNQREWLMVDGQWLMFFPGLASVFDDQIVDGTTYDIQVEKGVNRNEKIDLENYSFFHRGDSVTVKFTNIDKATFDFWRSMEFNYSSIGNPFSSPTKVLGNVKGALGYFGGYATQYKSIVVPK